MVVEIFFMTNLNERMWPDQGWNQQPLDSQSDSLLTALGGPALTNVKVITIPLLSRVQGLKNKCTKYEYRIS